MELHQYQKVLIKEVIQRKKIALWLSMGLGKTIIVLKAIEQLKTKALVVAPKTIVENVWKQEAEKWNLPLKVTLVIGTPEQRKKALLENSNIYVISRDNLGWLFTQEVDATMLVVDESTSLKNRSTLRWASLCQKSITYNGKKQYRKKPLLEQFDRVVLLSGTPASESYAGLWAQIYLLDKGERLETTIGRFRDKYMTAQLYNGYPVYNKMKPGAIQEINERIKDLCISLDYKLELERIDITHYVGTPVPAYWKLAKDSVITVDNTDIIATNTLTKYEKLQEINSGFIYDEQGQVHKLNNKKLESLQELIEDQNENVLIFYKYKYEREQLESIGGIALDTPEAIQRWNKKRIKIGLLQPLSSGRGLNLEQGGSVAIWYTLPLSLEDYIQSNARILRQGQVSTVRIYHLITRGSIDTHIYKLLNNKREVLQGLLEYFGGG